MTGDWGRQAACLGMDVNVFFPIGGSRTEYAMQVEDAKRVCWDCPVQGECLEGALESREKYGILGGLTAEERSKLLRRVRRVAV